LVATAALSVALLLPATVAANGPEPIRISPWLAPYTLEVDEGTPLYVDWGWFGCTYGLAQHVRTAYTQWYELVRIGDEPEAIVTLSPTEAGAYWGAPFPADVFAEACIIGQPRGHEVRWRFDLPMLAPGTYELAIHIDLDHTITDGTDMLDGDGHLDLYRPGAAADAVVTIHVNAP
jgi:hypothetical protein